MKKIYIDENLSKSYNLHHTIGYPGGDRFMGNGLVTETNHEKWKTRRGLFNPGFHRQWEKFIKSIMIEWIISLRVLITFMKEFNSKTDILIDFLRKKANG